MASLVSGFGSFSKERILGALKHLSEPEQRDLAQALEAQWHAELDVRCGEVKVDEVENCLVSDPSVGCLYWLQNLTLTEDEHWLAKKTAPKAPFPRKTYFNYVLGAMQRPVVYPAIHCQQLYIPKSREMMTSYLACGYVAWLCQWHPNIFCVLQSQQEAKAEELIRYTKILYDNQPAWLKKRHPLVRDNATVREFENGSRILGLPKGQNQVRSLHPFLYMADEAAFLEEFGECVAAVQPVAKQIIAISTANPGPFGDACVREFYVVASSPPSGPRPDPVPEPEPAPTKSLEQQLEEARQRILNPVDPALALFVQRRDEEQARRSSWEHSSGAYSSVPPPAMHPADQDAEIHQLEEAAAENHWKRKP